MGEERDVGLAGHDGRAGARCRGAAREDAAEWEAQACGQDADEAVRAMTRARSKVDGGSVVPGVLMAV